MTLFLDHWFIIYAWLCRAELCSSVVWRYLSSILVSDYKSNLWSIFKENNYSSLPSVNSYETRIVVPFLKTCRPVFCIFRPPLHHQRSLLFGCFESVSIFSFCLLAEGRQTAIHTRRVLTVTLQQRLLCLHQKRTPRHWKERKFWLVISLQISNCGFCALLELLLQNLVETYLKVNATTLLSSAGKQLDYLIRRFQISSWKKKAGPSIQAVVSSSWTKWNEMLLLGW